MEDKEFTSELLILMLEKKILSYTKETLDEYYKKWAELEVGDIEKKYSVLKGIDLEAGEGDSVCIMGKSGCGKTTLLKILGTIDKATHGNVIYNGINVRKYSDTEIA